MTNQGAKRTVPPDFAIGALHYSLTRRTAYFIEKATRGRHHPTPDAALSPAAALFGPLLGFTSRHSIYYVYAIISPKGDFVKLSITGVVPSVQNARQKRQ